MCDEISLASDTFWVLGQSGFGGFVVPVRLEQPFLIEVVVINPGTLHVDKLKWLWRCRVLLLRQMLMRNRVTNTFPRNAQLVIDWLLVKICIWSVNAIVSVLPSWVTRLAIPPHANGIYRDSSPAAARRSKASRTEDFPTPLAPINTLRGANGRSTERRRRYPLIRNLENPIVIDGYPLSQHRQAGYEAAHRSLKTQTNQTSVLL